MLRRLPISVIALLLAALAVGSCTDKMVAPPPPPDPVADYAWSGVTVAPAQISFQNLSLHADEYIWNFGDSTTSNDTNPTHIYARAGLYDVMLTARSSETGVSNFKAIQLPIDAGPVVADFSMPATAVTVTPITFQNHSQNAGRYRWSFGDGRVSDLTSPTITFLEYRSFTVTLVATSRDGRRSNTATKSITVNPSQVYLVSVWVVQYPPVDPSNHPWDPSDGPDLLWKMAAPSGSTIYSPILGNVSPDSLPVGWRTPGASLPLSNWNYPYLLVFYDYDAPDSTFMGTAGFTVNQLPVGGEYPRDKVFLNDQMRVRIVVHWM